MFARFDHDCKPSHGDPRACTVALGVILLSEILVGANRKFRSWLPTMKAESSSRVSVAGRAAIAHGRTAGVSIGMSRARDIK
jgi:hypothetical protein